jgi:hypothetical protein
MKKLQTRLTAAVLAVVALSVMVLTSVKAQARRVVVWALEPFYLEAMGMKRREGLSRFWFLPRPLVLHVLHGTGNVAAGKQPMPIPSGSEVVAVRLEAVLSTAPGANDTFYLADLPEDCVPVDCLLDAPDLDTNGAPTIAISAGFLNAAKTDLDGTAWIVASTIGQAGGLARPTTNTMVRTAPSSARKPVGLKFTAAAATFAAGTVGLTLFYRAAHFGK